MFKKNFTFTPLTLEATTFYKGLAILMIVLHNYFHWLAPKIGENEQYLDPQRVRNYIDVIANSPEFFIQATFSFLGHYGVQMFLFLSAYGLTKKHFDTQVNYVSFLKTRFLKLYPAFLLAIVFWAFYVGLKYGGPITVISNNWESLVYKLLLISNFIPGELYSINGPWWFISLIFQFYIMFHYMLKLYYKFGNTGLVLLSFAGLLLSAFLQSHVSIRMGGTVLIHLPELSLGIFLAREKNVRINSFTMWGLLIVFVLSNYYEWFWYASYISVLILLLILFQKIYTIESKKIFKFILFTGSISMYIFLINGFLRNPWIGFARHFDTWYMNIVFCMGFLGVVLLLSYGMMIVFERLKRMVNAF